MVAEPHSWAASAISWSALPMRCQSSRSNSPSSQPRTRSGASISTRSQSTLPVSAITLIRAISPLYSPSVSGAPLAWAKGLKKASLKAFCPAPP
ncbi:hypothetical protein D3C85_701150 [compost metagenome]